MVVHQERLFSVGQLYYQNMLIVRNPKHKADQLLVDQMEPDGTV